MPYKLLRRFSLRAPVRKRKPNAPINDVGDGPIRGCARCRYRLGVLWRAARESASERDVPTATGVSTPATPAPSQSAQYPIRIDGERSELRLESEDIGLRTEKPGVTLRTPVGNFDLRW
jgi:hypothetical protein